MLSDLGETANDKYSIVAIGSSNATADSTACHSMLALGDDRVVYTYTDITFHGFYHR
jgi:hypothetical protein